jgi:hypothetical protein
MGDVGQVRVELCRTGLDSAPWPGNEAPRDGAGQHRHDSDAHEHHRDLRGRGHAAPKVCGRGPLRGAHAVSRSSRIADAQHVVPRLPACRHWNGRRPIRCGSAALGPRAELLGRSRRVRGARSTRPRRQRDLRPGRSCRSSRGLLLAQRTSHRGCGQVLTRRLDQDRRYRPGARSHVSPAADRRCAASPSLPQTGAVEDVPFASTRVFKVGGNFFAISALVRSPSR